MYYLSRLAAFWRTFRNNILSLALFMIRVHTPQREHAASLIHCLEFYNRDIVTVHNTNVNVVSL